MYNSYSGFEYPVGPYICYLLTTRWRQWYGPCVKVDSLFLQTDMCYHFEVMQKFKAVSARKVKSEEALLATLAMFLKCADLGHSALPWTEHLRWFRMLEEVRRDICFKGQQSLFPLLTEFSINVEAAAGAYSWEPLRCWNNNRRGNRSDAWKRKRAYLSARL